MTDAERCRQHGWVVGTVLRCEEGRVQITGIGESLVLGVVIDAVSPRTGETVIPRRDEHVLYSLRGRDWTAEAEGASHDGR